MLRLMRRLIQSYLTISAVIILLANLALIILYGRQFNFRAAEQFGCTGTACNSQTFSNDFLVANIILAGLLIVIWFVLDRIFQHQSKN